MKKFSLVKSVILVVLATALISCKKDKDDDKLSVTCHGDCNNFSFTIGNETGPVTANITSNYTYDSYGNITQVTSNGTLTYQNSGRTYQVNGVVNYITCKYKVTVNHEYICGN